MSYSPSVLCLLFAFISICSLASQDARSPRQIREWLDEEVVRNEVFNEGFTGFRLVDAENGSALFDWRGSQFFTPASNVKLLTFYLATELLADSMTAIYYDYSGDTLEILGSGSPLLFHPELGDLDAAAPFMRNHPGVIRYHHREISRYGAGWSWDDYNYGYVYERSMLPVYGNRLTLRSVAGKSEPEILPPNLADSVVVADGDVSALVKREKGNKFTAALRLYFYKNTNVQRPLTLSPQLIVATLRAGLQREVILATESGDSLEWRALKQPLPDTVLQIMLQKSDNFLAEQLLLSAADALSGQPELEALFAFSRDSLLAELELLPRQWVDGSGLSRYNQFTPRQLTQLIRRVYFNIGPARTKKLLAAGGESGTIRRYFGQYREPYVWAKSGSLRNVLALSGLVETKSGRLLVFSFLHNNFPGKSRPHYQQMERILGFVRDNF
ncbi:hypothetical protein CEQ90_11260 [Lewinellaceae bacterium SD302]|nr:hypothetical protein CEQ90_11260 [Lewinellaceae bacterium SD302]